MYANERSIQAILIADSYHDNFAPITNSSPLSLLPVGNVPLIEYNLENLNRNGVQEVIVLCSNHKEQLLRFVNQRQAEKSTWTMNMTITIISCSESCRSLGEALRDLDSRRIIRDGSDVILLGAGSLTNANLAALLKEHRRFKGIDRGAAMTVVYKKAVKRMRTGNEVLVVIDPSSRRLLHHHRLAQRQVERCLELPLELFVENRDVTICHGMLDPHIAICSHFALSLFADNFDFLTRDDFVRGLLVNEEILNSRIYVTMLGREEYAMRVNNWQTYHFACLDVMNRWVYPLVPDMVISQFRRRYKHYRNNVYRHRHLRRLSYSCHLAEQVVVDENCSIEEDTFVLQSTVGRGCKIGRRCRIQNSFLFEDAVVGDDCVLDHCIIGKGVQVGAGCILSDGTVLGDEVVIPSGMKLTKLLVQASKPMDEERCGTSRKLADRAYTVPKKGEDSDVSNDDDEVAKHFHPPVMLEPLRANFSPSVYEPSDDEENSGMPSPVPDDACNFFLEVVESLKRGLDEQINAEYLILEINSSRYAYNMPLNEVNFYVVKAILQIWLAQEGIPRNAVDAFRKLVAYFEPVLISYIRDQDAMFGCLKAFQEVSNTNIIVRLKIAELVHCFYDRDLVYDEVIVRWYAGLTDEVLKKLLVHVMTVLSYCYSSEDDDDDKEK